MDWGTAKRGVGLCLRNRERAVCERNREKGERGEMGRAKGRCVSGTAKKAKRAKGGE